jgi:hypothetical protein
MNDYILYSDRKANRHVFLMREPNGNETVITSDEVNLYNENFGGTMDIHHGLVRFMLETVDVEEDSDKIQDVLRVPFDKFKDLK